MQKPQEHSDALEHAGTHLAPGNVPSAHRMKDQNMQEPPWKVERSRQCEQALSEENIPTPGSASPEPDSGGDAAGVERAILWDQTTNP